jgi:hypothetical protein
MISQATIAKPNMELAQEGIADYFGVRVQVILRMSQYSLIRYRGRELIVSTEDLQLPL